MKMIKDPILEIQEFLHRYDELKKSISHLEEMRTFFNDLDDNDLVERIKQFPQIINYLDEGPRKTYIKLLASI